MAELAREPVTQYQPGLMLRQQIDDLCRTTGVELIPVVEVSMTLLASQMAAEGIGVAIVDVLSAHPYIMGSTLKLLPIKPERWWRVGLFTLRSRPPGQPSAAFRKNIIGVAKSIIQTSQNQPLLRTNTMSSYVYYGFGATIKLAGF